MIPEIGRIVVMRDRGVVSPMLITSVVDRGNPNSDINGWRFPNNPGPPRFMVDVPRVSAADADGWMDPRVAQL